MRVSTLCYITQDDAWLMLLRNKKSHDVNRNKWIGVGGKLEEGESVRQCMYREIQEETGLHDGKLNYCGILYFYYDGEDSEKIYVFQGTGFSGNLIECPEGELAWIDKDQILSLPLWEGDRLFLKDMLDGKNLPFTLSLYYDSDGNLKSWNRLEAEPENCRNELCGML